MSIPLTVESLAGGGAVERLHKAIQDALDNILDPNTEAKKPRKVKMILTIKPKEARNMGDMTVETSTVLCAPKPLESTILIDQGADGRGVACELASGEIPGQQALSEEMHPDGKIAKLSRKAQ
jgi:hypothetical protein